MPASRVDVSARMPVANGAIDSMRARAKRVTVGLVIAARVIVATGTSVGATTKTAPSGCIAAWNTTAPATFRHQVAAGQARHAYVALETLQNQVPLAHPLCVFSFALPGNRT